MAILHHAVLILVIGVLMFTAGYHYGEMNTITWAICYDAMVGGQ